MSGLFLSVQCVHAATLASDCAVMLNVENESDVQTEQSLASRCESVVTWIPPQLESVRGVA
jgi:hypothetical protein